MTKANNTGPIETECYYHIFNRAVYKNQLFVNDGNYEYFLKLVDKYLSEVVTIYSYCLLPNHFHFLVKTKAEVSNPESTELISKRFNSLFSAYAQAFNKQQKRYGGLFQRPYRRKKINDTAYLKSVTVYIHRNPQSHQVVRDFSKYKWSSFQLFKDTNITPAQTEVLDWFGGIEAFMDYHLEESSNLTVALMEE
jgi:REP element-mobilizing transposase RayT